VSAAGERTDIYVPLWVASEVRRMRPEADTAGGISGMAVLGPFEQSVMITAAVIISIVIALVLGYFLFSDRRKEETPFIGGYK